MQKKQQQQKKANKQKTGGCIYQLLAGEFAFAATCSEKD